MNPVVDIEIGSGCATHKDCDIDLKCFSSQRSIRNLEDPIWPLSICACRFRNSRRNPAWMHPRLASC